MNDRWISAAISLWRVLCGMVVLVWAENIVGVVYGAFEVASAFMGLCNCWEAKEFDSRRRGWLVALCYCVGFIALPIGDGGTDLLALSLMLVMVIRLHALLNLGFGYSVGKPSWSGLADCGPYLVVRHPMEATGLLARVAFCVAYPIAWNWIGLALMTVASCWACVIEEEFLSQWSDWREYAGRVRWRLIPWVW